MNKSLLKLLPILIPGLLLLIGCGKAFDGATINSVNMDQKGWHLLEKSDATAVCEDFHQDLITLNFFPEKPEFPSPSGGIEELRNYFRDELTTDRSGIVSVDVVKVQGVDCIRIITKYRLEPSGFAYQGTCIIPRQDFSYAIHVQCEDHEPDPLADVRESSIMFLEMPDPELEEVKDAPPIPGSPNAKRMRVKGWIRDPYDPKYNPTAIYTPADQEKHDEKYPDHPLSRARRKLDHLIESLTFEPAVADAATYTGPE